MKSIRDFDRIGLRKFVAPAVVADYNTATMLDYTDATANIQASVRTANTFGDNGESKPLFVYQNLQSGFKQVGDKKYYKDSILFWDSVNKIMEGRTTKQQLGDISTEYVLSQFTDATYTRFFRQFYTTLHTTLQQYATQQGLSIPEDIALFYKGGNLFRIILTPFVRSIQDNDYLETLKKRSDADFQVYIRPDLPNYTSVYTEVVKRVLVCLYDFKAWLSDNNIIKINPTDLLASYTTFLSSIPGITVTKVSFVKDSTHPFRSDFMITSITPSRTGFKEEYSLLTGIDKRRDIDPALYISRNTASDFTTYSSKRYFFELIRLKRNLKIAIDYTSYNIEKPTVYLQVPSEVIDVSIPKVGDSSLDSMKGHITDFVQEYILTPKEHVSRRTFTFWGVSLEYLLYDLTDILFYKFEWPWLDAKYTKRLARFLLCLILANVNDLPALLKHLGTLLRKIRSNGSPSARGLPTSLLSFVHEHQRLKERALATHNSEIISKFNEYNNNVVQTLEKISNLVSRMNVPSSPLLTRFVTMVGGKRSAI